MAVTSGFFNSLNHDRKYNAEQMSAIFDGIINDGVFMNIGTSFGVKALTGSRISVGVGRAWFNSAWVYNDAELPLTAELSELVLNRYDAVVIEIDHTESGRKGSIKLIKGSPSDKPVPPTMKRTDLINQYPLAYIYRKGGTNEITQSDITNKVGTDDCPYITGILKVQSIDNIVAQWQGEWNDWKEQWDFWSEEWNMWFDDQKTETDYATTQWMGEMKAEFNTWFESLKITLSDDVAANLAKQILDLENNFEILAKDRCVYDELEDSNGIQIEDNNNIVIQGKTSFNSDIGSSNAANAFFDIFRAEIELKQNKIYGTPDQVIGFSKRGDAIAVASPAPKSSTGKLTVSGWADGQIQTILVPGVSGDEASQIIMPIPTIASQENYIAAGIRCVNQSENRLTFKADTIPSSDISIYITIQEVISNDI